MHELFDGFHGVGELHAHDVGEQVDGVAASSMGEADPVVVFDDDVSGQGVDAPVAAGFLLHGIAHFFKQRAEWYLPGCSDLFGCPFISQCHVLSSSLSAIAQRAAADGVLMGCVLLFTPMRLHEDTVDLIEADFALSLADGFEQGSDAEVAYAAQDAFGRAYGECEGVIGKGAVGQPAPVELVEDEGFDVVGRERFEMHGVGDAASDVVVDAQAEFNEGVNEGVSPIF